MEFKDWRREVGRLTHEEVKKKLLSAKTDRYSPYRDLWLKYEFDTEIPTGHGTTLDVTSKKLKLNIELKARPSAKKWARLQEARQVFSAYQSGHAHAYVFAENAEKNIPQIWTRQRIQALGRKAGWLKKGAGTIVGAVLLVPSAFEVITGEKGSSQVAEEYAESTIFGAILSEVIDQGPAIQEEGNKVLREKRETSIMVPENRPGWEMTDEN